MLTNSGKGGKIKENKTFLGGVVMFFKQKIDEAKNIDLILETQDEIDLLKIQLTKKMDGKWLNCNLNQDSIECGYQIDESLWLEI